MEEPEPLDEKEEDEEFVPDQEDLMTNEEWLNYYDQNLATEVSETVSPVAKELAVL